MTVGNNTTDTNHAAQSQLKMNKPEAEKQDDTEKTYDFVIFDLQNDDYDFANQDTMNISAGNVAVDQQPYPSQSGGIPGRRPRLVPGSSGPWRVNEQA